MAKLATCSRPIKFFSERINERPNFSSLHCISISISVCVRMFFFTSFQIVIKFNNISPQYVACVCMYVCVLADFISLFFFFLIITLILWCKKKKKIISNLLSELVFSNHNNKYQQITTNKFWTMSPCNRAVHSLSWLLILENFSHIFWETRKKVLFFKGYRTFYFLCWLIRRKARVRVPGQTFGDFLLPLQKKKKKWFNYASGQKSAPNSNSFWARQLFNICVRVFCAPNATILHIRQDKNELHLNK